MIQTDWFSKLDDSTKSFIHSLKPRAISFPDSDAYIDIDDETNNVVKIDSKKLTLTDEYKKQMINNVSVFSEVTTYEQTLPSFVDFVDAKDLYNYKLRTIVFCKDSTFYETLPDVKICLRCGHIDYYPHGSLCKNCSRGGGVTQITPSRFQEPWVPYPAPRKIDPWTDIFQQIIDILKKTLYYDHDILYMIHALWIFASYRQQDFDVAPYLQFIAPVESGKTRALEITSLLSYRGVLYATISPAALCREINKYRITACVDQAEFNLDTRSEYGRENYNIFLCGYRKGQFYTRADRENSDDVVRKDVFSFKALASTRDFDEALSSRSIIFHMQKGSAHIRDVKKIMGEIQRVRMQLLYLHLLDQSPLLQFLDAIDRYNVDGRLREIYKPLVTVAEFLSLDTAELREFIEEDRKRKIKELQESLEGQIVSAIKEIIDEDCASSTLTGENVIISIKDIAERIDTDARVVGRKLNVLNLEKTKTREGRVIDLSDEKNRKQLQYLFKKYGLVDDHSYKNATLF